MSSENNKMNNPSNFLEGFSEIWEKNLNQLSSK